MATLERIEQKLDLLIDNVNTIKTDVAIAHNKCYDNERRISQLETTISNKEIIKKTDKLARVLDLLFKAIVALIIGTHYTKE